MYELKRLREGFVDRVAMVGTPCQIHTVRKMQVLRVMPSDVIKYFFGLFCMENFFFNDLELENLGERHGFDVNQIAKVNVKEDFFVYLKDGRVIHIPFEEIDSIARPACLVCPDFSAEYSDISFGGLGSPEGYTTVLIRSEKGKWIYREALSAGYIKERRYSSVQKARSDWMKTNTKVISFSDRKKTRALKNRQVVTGQLVNES
jgi:coenzyme F420 hydrogenase subunit beta